MPHTSHSIAFSTDELGHLPFSNCIRIFHITVFTFFEIGVLVKSEKWKVLRVFVISEHLLMTKDI